MAKKATKENCLAVVFPDVARLWHPTKNGELTPNNITAHSGKKVWWKCPVADDHEWFAVVGDVVISNNKNTTGCPYCTGKKVVNSNCLIITHPDVAKLWHPTKNGKLTPYLVTSGRATKVWWKCPVADDHEWFAAIYSVVYANISNNNSNGCTCCAGLKVVKSNCLSTLYPDVAKLWHPTMNGTLTPDTVTQGCGKRVWWQCPVVDKHKWFTRVQHVVHAYNNHTYGCPDCISSRGENLIKLYLQKFSIKFKQQYKISDCRNKIPLPFDFAVFINNKIVLIEYQGAQHYRAAFGKNQFERQQLHDNIKRTYCQTHDIPLLEIPYWLSDDEIIEKLSQFIQEVACSESINAHEPQIEAEKSYALCASE